MNPIISRRAALLGGVLLVGAAASETVRLLPVKSATPVNLEELPNRLGPWRSLGSANVILPRDEVTSNYYDQQLARTYGAPDLPAVMLAVAYGSQQNEQLEVHRPETCYPAQGFSIERSEPVELPVTPQLAIPSRFLVARRQDRTEHIIYWTRIGPWFPHDQFAQKLAVLRCALRRVPADGILVRMSVLGNDRPSLAVLTEFARTLIANIHDPLRQAFAGQLA